MLYFPYISAVFLYHLYKVLRNSKSRQACRKRTDQSFRIFFLIFEMFVKEKTRKRVGAINEFGVHNQ